MGTPARRPVTTLAERIEIRVLLNRGISTTEEVQAEFGRCKRTIDSILAIPEATRAKIGRPAGSFKAPPEYLSLLDALIDSNPEQFPQELRARMKKLMPEVCVSVKTVTNYRNGTLDWTSVKKTPKVYLTRAHMYARLLGCTELLGSLRHILDTILFTDEKLWKLKTMAGRVYVSVRRTRRSDQRRFRRRSKHGSVSVMTWAGMHRDFATPLIYIEGKFNSRSYINLLAQHVFNPGSAMMQAMATGSTVTFQQDGSGPHKVLRWLNSMPFGVLAQGITAPDFLRDAPAGYLRRNWMARSPDLPVIEKGWAHQTILINNNTRLPTSEAELKEALEGSWEIVSSRAQRKVLFDALPAVLAKCVLNDGDNNFRESRRCARSSGGHGGRVY
jgi:hypothetical protein